MARLKLVGVALPAHPSLNDRGYQVKRGRFLCVACCAPSFFNMEDEQLAQAVRATSKTTSGTIS